MESLLDELDRRSESNRPMARQLRAELRAEIDGARAAQGLTIFQRRGGYHAQRLAGTLAKVGQALAGTYQRLRGLSQADYLSFVTAAGMTVERLHQVVFLFSDLRTAATSRDDDALVLLQNLLPEVNELDTEYGPPPAVQELLSSGAAAASYPFHAALGPDEGARALAAHAAILAAETYIAQARSELEKAAPNRVRTVRDLDAVQQLSQYVQRLDYRLAGTTPSPATEIERLCAAWGMAVLERSIKDDPAPDPLQKRHEWEDASRMMESLASRYGLHGPDFCTARAGLHFNYGVFLAEHFRDADGSLAHLRIAYRTDSSIWTIVMSYMRACVMVYERMWLGDEHQARSVIQEGIRIAEEFLERHPGDHESDIRGNVEELRKLDGPPRPPTLPEPKRL